MTADADDQNASPSSRFRGVRILGAVALVFAALAYWQWREARSLSRQLAETRTPTDARLILQAPDHSHELSVHSLRGADLIEPVEKSDEAWQRILLPAENPPTLMSLEAPAGILEVRYGDRRFPVLLPRGEELNLSIPPQREGFAWIPPGSFLAELQLTARHPRDDKGVVHGRDGYFISETEVSIDEYEKFLTALGKHRGRKDGKAVAPRAHHLPFGPYCSEEERKASPKGCRGHRPTSGGVDLWLPEFEDGRRNKILRYVSYYDALAYCEYLKAEAAERSERTVFRLPTASEWQKAARGVDGRPFPWGFEVLSPVDRGAMALDLSIRSHPHLRSPYGLYHAGSGVSEWTSTPEGKQRRVIMGVSFDQHRDQIHLGYGIGESPWTRAPSTGFRVVRQDPQR